MGEETHQLRSGQLARFSGDQETSTGAVEPSTAVVVFAPAEGDRANPPGGASRAERRRGGQNGRGDEGPKDRTARAASVRTMFDETDTETGESPIDAPVAERVADETDLDLDELRTALVAVNSGLIGRHSRLERQGDYQTVNGVRAYRVPAEEWERILDGFDFSEETEGAVLRAHTEQTRMLFAESPDARERFEENEAGIVVGVDTAEEF